MQRNRQKSRSDLNTLDSLGFSPLHTAAIRGDLAEVKALVDKGENLELPDANADCTALIHAALHNHKDVVAYLLDSKADPYYKSKQDINVVLAAKSIEGERTLHIKSTPLSEYIENYTSDSLSIQPIH